MTRNTDAMRQAAAKGKTNTDFTHAMIGPGSRTEPTGVNDKEFTIALQQIMIRSYFKQWFDHTVERLKGTDLELKPSLYALYEERLHELDIGEAQRNQFASGKPGEALVQYVNWVLKCEFFDPAENFTMDMSNIMATHQLTQLRKSEHELNRMTGKTFLREELDNGKAWLIPLPEPTGDGAVNYVDDWTSKPTTDVMYTVLRTATTREVALVKDWHEKGNPFYSFANRPISILDCLPEQGESEIEGEPEIEDEYYYAGAMLKHALALTPSQFLYTVEAPDWKVIRDNAWTLKMGHTQVKPLVARFLQEHNHDTLLVVPDDQWGEFEIDSWLQHATRVKLSTWIKLSTETKQVIKANLVKHFTTDHALDFMELPQDHVFGPGPAGYTGSDLPIGKLYPDFHLAGQPKWWVQAAWLNEQQKAVLPVNYRNIVFLNASELLAKDQLKPATTFQYLAQLGRITTQVFFLG